MENTATQETKSPEVGKKTCKMPKPNNMFNVDCENIFAFYQWWCVFMRPFINLTDMEIKVVASLLKQRWELSKTVSDDAILDMLVMSNDCKAKVIEECEITKPHFDVIKSALKKKGVIKNNIINPQLIPNRKNDSDPFRLLIQFNEIK